MNCWRLKLYISFFRRALQFFEDGDFETVSECLEAEGSKRGTVSWSPHTIIEAAQTNFLRGVAHCETKGDV